VAIAFTIEWNDRPREVQASDHAVEGGSTFTIPPERHVIRLVLSLALAAAAIGLGFAFEQWDGR
jgi:hypothetical protein